MGKVRRRSIRSSRYWWVTVYKIKSREWENPIVGGFRVPAFTAAEAMSLVRAEYWGNAPMGFTAKLTD